jgi:hypothetical protein
MTMPAPIVELYSDFYAVWTNHSSDVVMQSGLSIKRGRASQFDRSSPGTFTFTLDNEGNFYTPNVGFYGYNINTQVRVTIDSYQVWTGYIDSFSYTVVPGFQQTIQIACTDKFKHYAKASLSSYGIEQFHYNGTLNATSGATYALQAPRDGVGSFWEAFRDVAASPIRIYGATSGGSHEFTDDGPAFVKSAIKIDSGGNQNGPVLEHPTSFNPGTENATVGLWFKTELQSEQYLIHMFRTSGGTGYLTARINSTGGITVNCAGDSVGSLTLTTSRSNLWDNTWHLLSLDISQVASKTYVTVKVDGVSDVSGSATNLCSISATNRRIVFGGFRNSAWTDNSFCINGSMALIGLYKFATAYSGLGPDDYYAGALGITQTGYLTAFDGDTIATRSSNLAGYVDATAVTTANLGTSPTLYLAGQDTADKTYLEAMQEIADSERGIFYIDRLGTPKFRGSAARASGASVTLTLDASKDLTGDLTFTLDDSLYANTVAASGPAGSVTKLDATSVAAYGPLVDQFACLGSTETILGAAADNRLDDRLYTDMRLSKVVIDLLTTPNAIAATTVQLVPLDRVRVGSLPNEAPTTPFDGFVEGWELSITDSSYTCTLDLSPVI